MLRKRVDLRAVESFIADFLEAVEDTPIAFQVSDLQANDWNDDPWAVLFAVNSTGGGTAVLSEDWRTILFTPAADFHGQASFTYTLEEGDTAAGA